jgi:hypothetical protein
MWTWRYSSTNFNFGPGWRCLVSFTSWALYSWGKILRYSLVRRLGRSQSRSGHCGGEKNLSPLWELNPGPSARSLSLYRLSCDISAHRLHLTKHYCPSEPTFEPCAPILTEIIFLLHAALVRGRKNCSNSTYSYFSSQVFTWVRSHFLLYCTVCLDISHLFFIKIVHVFYFLLRGNCSFGSLLISSPLTRSNLLYHLNGASIQFYGLHSIVTYFGNVRDL